MHAHQRSTLHALGSKGGTLQHYLQKKLPIEIGPNNQQTANADKTLVDEVGKLGGFSIASQSCDMDAKLLP